MRKVLRDVQFYRPVRRRRCGAGVILSVIISSGVVLFSIGDGLHGGRAAEPDQAPTSEVEGPPTPGQLLPSPAAIDGFRHAHFGMSENEVRHAMRKDFPAAVPRLKTGTHPSEKTTVLSLTVPELLPNTGNAQLSYILGYKSKKLIQVNVVWTSQGTSEADDNVVATANMLRNYFAGQSYKPESFVANRQLAEHTILVFRGADAQGRTVLLMLIGAATAARKEAKPPQPPPLTLQLSYIADPTGPDVFRIGKGQF
jgi:hypothetical protein